MGMDYMASRYGCIPEDVVTKIIPKAWIKFKNYCDSVKPDDLSFAEVLHDLACVNSDSDPELECTALIMPEYQKLCTSFRKKTGLALNLKYVGEGLRGSDITEASAWFTNAYIRNPKAVALEKKYDFQIIEQWHLDCG